MALEKLIYKIDQLLLIAHMHNVLEALKFEAPIYQNFADSPSSAEDVREIFFEQYHKSIIFVNFNKTHKKYFFIFHTLL